MIKKESYGRDLRISELLKQELSHVLRREVNEQILHSVTITDLQLSKDYKHAKVYFATLGNLGIIDEVLKAFKRAQGFLRFCLKKNLDLKMIPELRFEYDSAFDYSAQIQTKLKEINDREEGARASISEELGEDEEQLESDRILENVKS